MEYCKDKLVREDLRGDAAAVATAAEEFLEKNDVAKQIVQLGNCRDIEKKVEEIQEQVNFDGCNM